ncbi:conserved hypothetical protein [Tenacibaculum sp. 190524A05c]|uniref:hypothetical protein n=1 Tax=Tenacibaculum platacis TaxID=3137852 RepID=UPI0031FAB1AB
MRNNYKRILFMVFFLVQEFCFSQGYRPDYLTSNGVVDCGQTTTNYGDSFDIQINTSGNRPTGYTEVEIGRATEDGSPCEFENRRNVNLNVNQAFCNTFSFDLYGCCSGESGTFRIIPDSSFKIITPNPGSNNRRTEITLEATPGYYSSVYNWKYFDIFSNSWKLFPSRFLGQSSITFDASDLFGANAGNYIDRSIQYKIEMCNGWSPTTPYTYVFEFPSPELSGISTKPTTCNYDSDGEFTLNVQRNLLSGEELVVTLYNTSNILIGQQFTTSLINNGNGTYGFKWPVRLDAGNYRIKYQTHGGRNGINANDPSWNSLVFTNFTINEPAKVIFSVVRNSDENCFAADDGYIDISASRENGRSLFYQLTKDGVIQRFNGASWVNYNGSNPIVETYYSFDNATTTRISKLGEGIYRVKVRDSQECYMRNN